MKFQDGSTKIHIFPPRETMNLKEGKEGKRQQLISTYLLVYQRYFLEAMIEKSGQVVQTS